MYWRFSPRSTRDVNPYILEPQEEKSDKQHGRSLYLTITNACSNFETRMEIKLINHFHNVSSLLRNFSRVDYTKE